MRLFNKLKLLCLSVVCQLFCVGTALADVPTSPIPISSGTKAAFSNDGTTGAILYIFTQDIIPLIQVALIVGGLFYCGISLFSSIRECLSEKHMGPLKQTGVMTLIVVLLVGLIVYLLGLTATAFTPG